MRESGSAGSDTFGVGWVRYLRGGMTATKQSRLSIYLALAASCGLCAEAFSATAQKVPLPRPRPAVTTAKQPTPAAVAASSSPQQSSAPLSQKRPPAKGPALSSYAQANVGLRGAIFETRAVFKPLARPTAGPFAIAPTTSTSDADIAAVKRVIEATRKGKEGDATAAEASISDPVARKLAEWIFLRSDNTNPTFQRYAAWVEKNQIGRAHV